MVRKRALKMLDMRINHTFSRPSFPMPLSAPLWPPLPLGHPLCIYLATKDERHACFIAMQKRRNKKRDKRSKKKMIEKDPR